MYYIAEKEQIIKKKKWTTEYSRAFFNNQRKNCDKLMVFGSCCSNHGFIVNEDSKLFGFGCNKYFQLGLGDNNDRTELSEIKFFSSKRIRKISCGTYHSIFIIENNEVYSTGSNAYGQLGVNDFLVRKIPTRVVIKHQNEIIKVIDIFVGNSHSIVLSNLLEVYSFGYNAFGQLGIGDQTSRKTAQRINFSEKIISVCCGCYHSCFISIKGSVFACGYNNYCQLGLPKSPSSVSLIPKKISFYKNRTILQVACGYSFTFFVSEDNQIYATGFNGEGCLGIGNIITPYCPSPCLVAWSKDEKVILVKCGGGHSIFKCKKKLMIFGCNKFGQIGKGNENVVTSPEFFSIEGKKIIQSLLLLFSSIHFTKNEVFGCGKNDWGQLFCGKTKEKNSSVFKIRNLKVKKRNLKTDETKEVLERFRFILLKTFEKDKLLFF